jgi:putative transposase
VSRRSYDDYIARQNRLRIAPEALPLRSRVQAIHAETAQSYGSRRIAKQLQAEGFAVGRYRVRRLMKEVGVAGKCRASRRPQTTDRRHGFGVAPHLLARRFDVDRPKAAWCGAST